MEENLGWVIRLTDTLLFSGMDYGTNNWRDINSSIWVEGQKINSNHFIVLDNLCLCLKFKF